MSQHLYTKFWNFAVGKPDLVDTLLEAYHRSCLIALLAAGQNQIDGHHSHNIPTAEHVASVLLGNAICSITPTYCSTLPTGATEAIVELENVLRSLFKSLL
jgi:hypothetical protein